MRTATATLTASDYRELPEGGPRYQLIEGDLHMAPAPDTEHQRISRNLEYLLLEYLEKHPLGELLHAPVDLYLTETDVYQPDILFVANTSRAIIWKDGIHGGPELVVEILSPSTRRFDLGSKKRVYARCGVIEYWVIDPATLRIEIFDLRENELQPAATWRADDRFGSRFFPGLEIPLDRVFPKEDF